MPPTFEAIIVAASLAVACAALSVFVVARQWAFVGEGISHSGFGGAGTAWLAAAIFPSLDRLWIPYAAVFVFCIGTAVGIGILTRRGLATDTAVGVFLAASLAWGFVGQQAYLAVHHKMPMGFENVLFGRQLLVSRQYAFAAASMMIAVLVVIAAFWKEIVAFTFDPLLARTSGVRVTLIHFALMILLAVLLGLTIPMAGSVLSIALLVVPGAAALQVCRRMNAAIATAIAVALVAAAGGLALHAWNVAIPTGPAMVLILVVEFAVAFAVARLERHASTVAT